jgi:hypothetical protein
MHGFTRGATNRDYVILDEARSKRVGVTTRSDAMLYLDVTHLYDPETF